MDCLSDDGSFLYFFYTFCSLYVITVHYKYQLFIMDGSLPIPYVYSKYLFYSSFSIGASSVVSAYYKDYVSFLFMFMLFLTSINYWYNPDYGLRRDIDMFLCKIISLYFYLTTLSVYDEYCNVVFVNVFYNILFLYSMEHLCCYFKNSKWIVFHMAIHLHLSLFSPFVLYIL